MTHLDKFRNGIHYVVPLLIMTVAGFTFNTSELIPVALLSDIGADLGVSEARTGYIGGAIALCAAIYCLLAYIPARRQALS